MDTENLKIKSDKNRLFKALVCTYLRRSGSKLGREIGHCDCEEVVLSLKKTYPASFEYLDMCFQVLKEDPVSFELYLEECFQKMVK